MKHTLRLFQKLFLREIIYTMQKIQKGTCSHLMSNVWLRFDEFHS